MRRGVLIVGAESRSIGSDFRAIPRILGGFLAVLPLAVWRWLMRLRPETQAWRDSSF
jgi:hypothetical protein